MLDSQMEVETSDLKLPILDLQMDDETMEQKHKQERMRTRWTPCLDKIFVDLVVEQIQLGNRSNYVFDKKTWNHIRDEFNRRTSLNFNNNQLRKHLDILRTRYNNLKSAFNQQDNMEDYQYIGFDFWEDTGVQEKPPETTKVKECPIYDQLSTIFADSGIDGKYAQSSHYELLDKSPAVDMVGLQSEAPCPFDSHDTPTIPEENGSSPQNMIKNISERKRKHPPETGCVSGEMKLDEKLNTMAQALLQMVAASRLRTGAMSRNEERFTITNCIKALDEIQGIGDQLYYAALDLFEEPKLREIFLSLKSTTIRLTWLQGKCGLLSS